MKEIERKWIVKELPNVSGQTPLQYERYFLFNADGIEVRIQRKGDKYEFERKVEASELTRTGQKFEISEAEYSLFQELSIGEIIRESYIVNNVSVKVYKGKHKGLIRAEIEFESEEEATTFEPLDWFGEEITNTDLGKDKKLMNLDERMFQSLLDEYLGK
jgi:adenylate cyclase